MRYTVIDDQGVVSFVADCNTLSVLVAACADNPPNLEQLLEATDKYDRRLKEYVTCGLAVFDEHNAPGNFDVIHEALEHCLPHELPVFRVVDEATRQSSLNPVKAGVVIFNLLDQRIIQIQNSFAEITRSGKVPIHDGQTMTNKFRKYQLPDNWSLVPNFPTR